MNSPTTRTQSSIHNILQGGHQISSLFQFTNNAQNSVQF